MNESDERILLGHDDLTLLMWWKMLYSRRWPDELPDYSIKNFEVGGRADQIMTYIEDNVSVDLQTAEVFEDCMF